MGKKKAFSPYCEKLLNFDGLCCIVPYILYVYGDDIDVFLSSLLPGCSGIISNDWAPLRLLCTPVYSYLLLLYAMLGEILEIGRLDRAMAGYILLRR